jgi:predicted HAD superfamily Cof-like phosphohydrolase
MIDEPIDVVTLMTDEQRKRLDEPRAWQNTNRVMGFPLGATPFQMTGHFHQIMGLPAPATPIVPSVSMRERRLRLIFEEFLELVEANGFELIAEDGVHESPLAGLTFSLMHIEGSRYDVVECADALGDLNVVVGGTAVEYGIPLHFIDYEVYTSNLSKLDIASGKPIVNHCTVCGPNEENIYYSTCKCDSEENWLKPGVPIGKILKPDSFMPANIPSVLLAYQNEEI